VGPVEISVCLRQFIVTRFEILKSLLVHSADRLTQISVYSWIFQIEYWRFVVLKYPRINRVLSEILCTSLRVCVQDSKIVKIGDFTFNPLVCVFLNRNSFSLAVNWQVVEYAVVYSVSVFLRIKRDVKCVLLRAFLNNELQSDLHEFEPAFEEFFELFDWKVNNLFLVNVVERLKVNALIRYI